MGVFGLDEITMKFYETGRLIAEPFLPPLYKQVRHKMRELIHRRREIPKILDIGGRKSPYTIGLPAQITVIDLPRESDLQKQLNLGINAEVIDRILKRRSNIEAIVFGDMTCSNLPAESFDCAVAVEVLEHVEEDELFVKETARVLKNGGVFLMTTPNGDWVENRNPDHKRHYKKQQLQNLLEKYFDTVTVEYAIIGGRCRTLGLKSWSAQKPLQTVGSIIGNVVNSFQSAPASVKTQAEQTFHLIAVAAKNAKTF